jgi:hypothetical protein
MREKGEKRVKSDQGKGNREATHDCAFLEPLAFPPDLPPVILGRGCWISGVDGRMRNREMDGP